MLCTVLCFLFTVTVGVDMYVLNTEDFGYIMQVFMIGLVRCPDRRNRMLACFDELAFNYTIFDAVDGK